MGKVRSTICRDLRQIALVVSFKQWTCAGKLCPAVFQPDLCMSIRQSAGRFKNHERQDAKADSCQSKNWLARQLQHGRPEIADGELNAA